MKALLYTIKVHCHISLSLLIGVFNSHGQFVLLSLTSMLLYICSLILDEMQIMYC